MTLQQLKYISAIAELGTISEASNRLFVSQPSLTNAVKDVEAELGFDIFKRTNKGITVTSEGEEFLGYARQVLEQNSLLEQRYLKGESFSPKFSVSTQHYSFAVKAFVEVLNKFDSWEYDFTIRETQTYEIIEDVSKLKSEIGIIFESAANQTVIDRFLKKNSLEFHELFIADPHVLISAKHPLADKEIISIEDLEDYPYLSFEQGEYNSFFFSEEILSTVKRRKNLRVSDRATGLNLIIGLNAYTFSAGIVTEDLNGTDVIARKLDSGEKMRIGYIVRKNAVLSEYALAYIKELQELV